jgi:hypothetical protein
MNHQNIDYSDERSKTLASIFNYPSLERLFKGDGSELNEMRRLLTATNQELERVIRFGTKDEASSAMIISRAYSLTLSLLDEIESYQNSSEKKI